MDDYLDSTVGKILRKKEEYIDKKLRIRGIPRRAIIDNNTIVFFLEDYELLSAQYEISKIKSGYIKRVLSALGALSESGKQAIFIGSINPAYEEVVFEIDYFSFEGYENYGSRSI